MVFVFDLDGTLLSSDETLSERNREAVLKVLKDHTVIFASGRMLKSVLDFEKREFEKEFPTIAYNGAMIYIPGKGIVFHDAIDGDTASKVIGRLRDLSVHRQAYVNDELVAEEENDELKSYADHSGVGYRIVKDLSKFVKEHGSTKILAISDPERLDRVREKLSKEFENLDIFKSFPTYLDFVKRGINKGKALKILSKMIGFSLDDVVSFGDNDNDYELLKISGLSIAVENATKKVKEVADFVAPSNDDSGVALAVDLVLSGRLRRSGKTPD